MNGYAISGQPPVLLPVPVDSFACLGDIVARVKAERADKQAAEAAEQRARNAVHIKAPTRAERIASLRGDMASARRELADLDNTQRWGRWTQDEFARKCAPAGATINLCAALLAQMGESL
jgi:hypothetical protein